LCDSITFCRGVPTVIDEAAILPTSAALCRELAGLRSLARPTTR